MHDIIGLSFICSETSKIQPVQNILIKSGTEFCVKVVSFTDLQSKSFNSHQADIFLFDYTNNIHGEKVTLDFLIRNCSEIPVILLTSPEMEAEILGYMNSGIADYVFSDHLNRLPFALRSMVQNNSHRLQNAKMQEEFNRCKNRLDVLFDYSPVSIREEDYSVVRKYFDTLSQEGVIDFRSYLYSNSKEIAKLKSMIKIIDINDSCLNEFGAKSKSYYLQNFNEYLTCESDSPIAEVLIALAEGKKKHTCDFRLSTIDGTTIDVLISMIVVPGYEKNLERVFVYFFNISELKRNKTEMENSNKALEKTNRELITMCEIAIKTNKILEEEIENRKKIEADIRMAQTRLETVLESMNDIILVSVNREYEHVFYNSAHSKAMMAEYNSTVSIGSNLLDSILIEEDRQVSKENFDLSFKGKSHITVVCIGSGKDFYEIRFSPVLNETKEIIGATAIMLNVNNRVRADNEILEKNKQLRQLNNYIIDVREQERTSIAREIHDQLGQSLTALKIDLTCMINDYELGTRNIDKINSMINLVSGTISDVQRISSELRPGVLDDLGLAAAIEWYCDDFEKRTGLEVTFTPNNVQSGRMRDNLTIYRVLQESLTNVIRHADAKKVLIKLREVKRNISLTVIDNGKGIAPDKIKSPASLGLRGMYERVAQSGGTIRITSPGGNGTKIQVYIPFNGSDL